MVTMKAPAAKILAALALGLMALNAKAVYVYDNSVNDQTNRLSAVDNLWFGDEVIMGAGYPANSTLTHFDFQYWAVGTTGLTIDVQLLYNTGAPYNGYATPDFSSPIYTFSGFALPNTGRDTINFDAGIDFAPGSINLSSATLTLAVQFHFNGGGGTAGVDLYNPPVVGAGYLDYWVYNGGNWELTTNNVFGTVNFGMRIEAVPEPTSFSIFFLGGLMALGFRRLFGKK